MSAVLLNILLLVLIIVVDYQLAGVRRSLDQIREELAKDREEP